MIFDLAKGNVFCLWLKNIRITTMGLQVKAIVEKIRQYFDIMNRNTLDDVDEVSVVQVGKFLQYMK